MTVCYPRWGIESGDLARVTTQVAILWLETCLQVAKDGLRLAARDLVSCISPTIANLQTGGAAGLQWDLPEAGQSWFPAGRHRTCWGPKSTVWQRHGWVDTTDTDRLSASLWRQHTGPRLCRQSTAVLYYLSHRFDSQKWPDHIAVVASPDRKPAQVHKTRQCSFRSISPGQHVQFLQHAANMDLNNPHPTNFAWNALSA